ncbi:hypothetical protein LshimejAT787_0403260 [Lyophyllum shimeji]|uniref:Uncharacterized protein n=1 Tax=Lyophyllum shimeji TaxID=47721 RepID=A0A9P3PJC8_LYOSH|nr:hypothetical protein LshimejAT787_0403260 [Lyophyllum shimeji]
MESPLTVLPIPRLRLSRATNAYDAPVAGPSRDRLSATALPADLLEDSDTHSRDDDDQPTPRMTSTAPLLDPAETPAARLRALLARSPGTAKSTPVPQRPSHSSDNESDFEPPVGAARSTSSAASETLKDIFSRALRDPGNTPQKNKIRPRRNSFDVSEVEASPGIQREKARNNVKRKSLSDEEIENTSKSYQRSEASFRSSQAASFNMLRERLTNTESQLKDVHLSDLDSLYEHGDTNGRATFLRDVNSITITPPAATSTPQQSLRMSVNSSFPFQSNLLEQDSEMRRAIEGLDSYEVDGASQRPGSFPPSRTSDMETREDSSPRPTEKRSEPLMSYKTDEAVAPQKGSDEFRSSSRASSANSISDAGRHAEDPDRLRERERQCNRPRTPARAQTPELSHKSSHQQFPRSGSPVVGPGKTLSRRGSNASLRSFDDSSSRASSFGSQAEYRERLAELERERNKEREREWNKPHPNVTRSSSSLSIQSPKAAERARTRSLIQLGSARVLSPAHNLQPHHSHTDSSRASSPTSSLTGGHEKADSEEEEINHERERNWNAPRPKWTHHDHHRPQSPLPSQSPDPPSEKESFTASGVKPGESPVHERHLTPSASRVGGRSQTGDNISPSARAASPLPPGGRSTSPLTHHNKHKDPQNQPPAPRTKSPLPPTTTIRGKRTEAEESNLPQSFAVSHSHKTSLQTPAPHSRTDVRAGFSLVRHRTPLPPLELERDTPERPSVARGKVPPSPSPAGRPANRDTGSLKPSGIPVRSPRKSKPSTGSPGQNGSTPPTIKLEPPRLPSHATPSVPSADNHHLQNETSENEQTEAGDLSQERTPTMRTVPPPPAETPGHMPPRSPSPPPQQNTRASDESRLRKALGPFGGSAALAAINGTSDHAPLQELSPPPSPPSQSALHPSQSSPRSFLSTPPRRSSFSSSKLEFQTPSPPKNLPELPGPPPSSSEDEASHAPARTPPRDLRSDLTAMKTPRPPGGWSTTPFREQRRVEPSSSPADVSEDTANGGTTQTPTRESPADLTSTKTPKPPGGWVSTPGLSLPREPPTRTRSLSGDTDDERDSGLATPVASLSRASSLPAQTPKPPGGWMATPAARKSILKVRFDAQGGSPKGTTLTESSNDPPENASNGSAQTDEVSFQTGGPTKPSEDDVPPRTRTPELSTPKSPPSKRLQSPSRKSPGVRVLDAFGREVVQDEVQAKPSARKPTSGVRIVDAMGREISSEVDRSDIEISRDGSENMLNHGEAVAQIRQGLSELVEGLDAMDRSIADSQVEHAHAQELKNASETARTARTQLAHAISSNEMDIRDKVRPLRMSMKKHGLLMSLGGDRRWPNSWAFWAVLAGQLLLISVMYRLTATRARDLFLTTYYDPFYPDLHLYTSRPDTLRLSMDAASGPSWFSIPDTFQREGWKASSRQIWHNLSVIIWDWQQLLWEAFGDQTTSTTWPPT